MIIHLKENEKPAQLFRRLTSHSPDKCKELIDLIVKSSVESTIETLIENGCIEPSLEFIEPKKTTKKGV